MLTIRHSTPSDLPSIISIYGKARKVELLLAGFEDSFSAMTKDIISDYQQSGTVLVAEESGRVLGFAAYSQTTLDWLYVDPLFAHRGIGYALVQAILREHGSSPIRIRVLVGNTPAKKLYEKCGFRLVSQVSGTLPDISRTVQVFSMEHR